MRKPLLLAMLAVLLSCESKPSPPPPPPRPPTPPAAAVRVYSDVVATRERMEALAREARTWGDTLQKQARQFTTERIYERVPLRLDREAVTRKVRSIALAHGLGTKDFINISVEEVPPPARTLPESVPYDAPLVLDADDVVALVQVRVRTPPGQVRFPSDQGLRVLGPLLLQPFPLAINSGDAWQLKTPVFRDVRMPRIELPALDLNADLKAAGAPSMGELLSGPHRAFASDLQGEYVRYAAARADVEPLLPNLAKVWLNEARYREFERLRKEALRPPLR